MAAMMRERMVRIGNADFGIRANAAFAAEHHGGDACQVGLERDRLQIEHQLHIIAVLERNAGGLLGRRRDRIFLRGGDAHFDLADAGEILDPSCAGRPRPSSVIRRCASSRVWSRMLLRYSARRARTSAGRLGSTVPNSRSNTDRGFTSTGERRVRHSSRRGCWCRRSSNRYRSCPPCANPRSRAAATERASPSRSAAPRSGRR